jgi:hypothetical protein
MMVRCFALLGEGDFCVLVDLAGAAPDYYVSPTTQVQDKLLANWKRWFDEKPGRSARNRVIGIKLGRDDEWPLKFKDNWAALELK